jgi:hypothetical protein
MAPKKPIQKATVITTAREHQPQNASNGNKAVLDKIQKCLNRAYHANASEAEAKTALFLSQKLMSEHNVTQADLMANDTGSKAQYGGRSIVRIEKVAGSSRRVMKEAFVERLATAICTFFDCKSFSTDLYTSVDWTFFGIADNTVAAAAAFEMAHNLILEWACAYKGGGPTFSYRLGVADGLRSMANLEKRKELEDTRRDELEVIANEQIGHSKRDQSYIKCEKAASSISDHETLDSANDDINSMEFGEPQNDSDTAQNAFDFQADFTMDDAQNIELCDDVDETIDKYMKREPTEPVSPHGIPQSLEAPDTKVKPDPWSSTSMASRWRSEMQLVQFRATSEQVADDYLEEQNIKLHSTRARASNIRDRDSYSRGRRDSSKINVRQRTLK